MEANEGADEEPSKRPPSSEKTHGEVDYESSPLTRAEYISALVHLYRGELYRSTSWRLRLDNTTNWAVFTTAGLLTFSFGDVQHSHWTLLAGLALITVFLGFEARRFRFAHMWRSRVRMIEENFYGPILRRDPVSPEADWGDMVAEDLFRPRFKIGRVQAIRARLMRNYWAIYVVLLAAWVVKVVAHPETAHTRAHYVERLSIGFVPWWITLIGVLLFVLALVLLAAIGPRAPKQEMEYWTGLPAKKPHVIDV